MARKDEMEALVSKKPPPQDGAADYSQSKPASATHKALITRHLKMAYGQVAGEPVPQRLLDVLAALDGIEEKKS
ncbi:MAG: hypothetical protein KA153_05985 [Hyphomonadaceae bacterium]|nr:hypothetical protein [Hyphomonadaceae bacterium]